MLHTDLQDEPLIDKFCRLITAPNTSMMEVHEFLRLTKKDSEMKALAESKDSAGHYPIEYVVRHGNGDVLSYLHTVLELSFETPHPDKNASILDLCIGNESTQKYLFDLSNKAWLALGRNYQEIHIAACAGNAERIVEILEAAPSASLLVTHDHLSIFDFLRRFNHTALLSSLLGEFDEIIKHFIETENFESAAKAHLILSRYHAARYPDSDALSIGLQWGNMAMSTLEKAIARTPDEERQQFLLTEMHVHLARLHQRCILLESLQKNDYQFHYASVHYHKDSALKVFGNTSCQNITEFYGELIAFYLEEYDYLQDQLEEKEGSEGFNFFAAKSYIHLLENLNDNIGLLYKQIPDAKITKQLALNKQACYQRTHELQDKLEKFKRRFHEVGHLEEKSLSLQPSTGEPTWSFHSEAFKFRAEASKDHETKKRFFESNHDLKSLVDRTKSYYESNYEQGLYSMALMHLRKQKEALSKLQARYQESPEFQTKGLGDYFKSENQSILLVENFLSEMVEPQEIKEDKTDAGKEVKFYDEQDLEAKANREGRNHIPPSLSLTPSYSLSSSSITASLAADSRYQPRLFKGEPDGEDEIKFPQPSAPEKDDDSDRLRIT